MIIETKFNKGDKVYVIHNDEIRYMPIRSITATSWGAIVYELIEAKAATSLDSDRLITRSEELCFPALQGIVDYYGKKAK